MLRCSSRLQLFVILATTFLFALPLPAQDKVVWSDQEKPVVEQLRGLRKLDDSLRVQTTKKLALQIRALPKVPNKLRLAEALANLSTEGDFGRDTLQEVTTTLASALREQPPSAKPGEHSDPYAELASLVRYEHMQASSDSPQFAAAMAQLEADDAIRQNADFTLTDLQDTAWHLKDLRGKVVLVNFWATWCPPCQAETPDLEAAYEAHRKDGLVLVAIDIQEDPGSVRDYVNTYALTYTIGMDVTAAVMRTYHVFGLPTHYFVDRDGIIRDRVYGPLTRAGIEQRLAKIMGP
jgi:thiol-disulfide isomerase/thioredoxin